MAALRAPALTGGTNLGSFTIVRELGARRVPTYAVQSRGEDGAIELLVVERLARAGNENAAAALAAATKIVATLAHPNVVRVRPAPDVAGEVLVPSEFVDAERYDVVTAAAAKVGRPLALVVHLRVLVDVLGGLSALHLLRDAKGAPAKLLHGEACPANVLLGLDGAARLAHVCRARGGRNAPEASGYAAPELRADFASPSGAERADVYSCGVMLWEAVTGKRLFPGSDEARILARQTSGKLEVARAPRAGEWAASLGEIAARALATEPGERYATAAEMAADVRKAAGARLALKSAVAEAVSNLAGERIAARRRRMLAPMASGAMQKAAAHAPVPGAPMPSDVLSRALVDGGPEMARPSIPEAPVGAAAHSPDSLREIGAEMLRGATVGAAAAGAPGGPSSVRTPKEPPPPPPARPKAPALPGASVKPPVPTGARPPVASVAPATLAVVTAEQPVVISADVASYEEDRHEVTKAAPSYIAALARNDAAALELDLKPAPGPTAESGVVALGRPAPSLAARAISVDMDAVAAHARARTQARARRIVMGVLGAMVLLLVAAAARVALRGADEADAPPGGAASVPSSAPPAPPAPPTPTATNRAVPEPSSLPAAALVAPAGGATTAPPGGTSATAGAAAPRPALPPPPRSKKPYDPLGI